MRLTRTIFGIALLFTGACVGWIGDAGSNDELQGTPTPKSSEPSSFTCDQSATAEPAELRRLTMGQLRNTLRDLTRWVVRDQPLAMDVMEEVAPSLQTLPDDRREAISKDLHGSYHRLDQTIQQQHVEGIYATSLAVASALTKDGRLGAVVGACAIDSDVSNDDACLTAFIKFFGARALRHPLSAEEIAFFRGVYGSDTKSSPAAYADVIAVILNQPSFLYFVEHGDAPVDGRAGVFTLTSMELASRLSYHFWNTMPDDELWNVASDGTLLNVDTYEKQVDRLLSDPRARTTFREFFGDWLSVDDLPKLDARNSDPIMQTFSGADLPSTELREEMIADVLEMVDWYTWTKPAPLSDLLLSEKNFARGKSLAKIYGVEAWDGQSSPPSFPEGQRPGLLTRALFLTSGSANTRPIMKGVFIRRSILCDTIPPPPPGVNITPPQLSSEMTTREVVEELTQKPGTVCAGCHPSAINPLGFATENFDSLGRFRTSQRLFDPTGHEVGARPVDTSSIPRVNSDDTTPSAGARDVMQMAVKSGKPNACIARNYFRFAFARSEDAAKDGCVLQGVTDVLSKGGTLRDLLKHVAMTPEFRQRVFE